MAFTKSHTADVADAPLCPYLFIYLFKKTKKNLDIYLNVFFFTESAGPPTWLYLHWLTRRYYLYSKKKKR